MENIFGEVPNCYRKYSDEGSQLCGIATEQGDKGSVSWGQVQILEQKSNVSTMIGQPGKTPRRSISSFKEEHFHPTHAVWLPLCALVCFVVSYILSCFSLTTVRLNPKATGRLSERRKKETEGQSKWICPRLIDEKVKQSFPFPTWFGVLTQLWHSDDEMDQDVLDEPPF